MLYVFHVDAGQMTTYDMNLTLQSVSSLKAAIERKTRIAASSLVLLVSGGEVLQSDHMVSSYSAGTDTNPIYMFSKPSENESHLKQSMYSDLSPIVELSTGEFRSDTRSGYEGKSVAELKANVEMCCSLQPTVNTVITCASLAQQFSDLSHDVSKSCDQLVHEQHLQHQGWAAVVANLEDIFNEFCERSRNFKESFRKHRLKKDEYYQQLKALDDVLESLGKIPILPALQLNAEAHRFSAFDVFEDTDFEGQYYRISQPLDGSEKTNPDFGVEAFKLSEEDVFGHKEASSSKDASQPAPAPPDATEGSDEGVTFKAESYEDKEEPTLLHWIQAQGNKASLNDITDYCLKGLKLIAAEPLKQIEEELCSVLEYANVHGLKQIKGIEDRLYRLDQLLSEVKKLERDQHDQAASLIQYRERVNLASDPTVLPTLVQSHWCQLEKLLKGHQTLVDIRRRIAKSKDELSHILKARLKAVLMIENSMSVQDAHAMLSFQCFNRLARYFDIVGQLHRAPLVYVRAVHEVARRRTFSQAHLKWATDLAAKLVKIHEEEIIRRQDFNCLFEGHFLKSLFPGMTELPPAYATQPPPVFDARLPQVTEDDVELITTTFPQLASEVPNYDMETTVKFFQQRISASDHQERDIDVQVDFEKDFESETDVGDFERLSRQSTSQKQRVDISTLCVPETLAVSTVTEDNMDTHKINIEKLQDFLVKLYGLCRVNILLIREELARFKEDIEAQKKFLSAKYLEILEAWEKSNEENALKFREQTQRLTVDHELEMSDMKAALNSKDDIIETLKKEKDDLIAQHQKEIERLIKEHESTKKVLENTRDEIKSFENKLVEAEAQKQKELKESQEKMHLEYKAEIESLRSRFRLVALTNMDRSPSESSLEKIERTDVIEINSHNAIVMQTKENAEVEKEEAVKQAAASVEAEWRQKLSEEVGALKTKYETEKQVTIHDVTRRLLAEKDRQLELLREREHVLARECAKYRDTIQQLTDPETNEGDPLLRTQLASLENEKAMLQQQILDLKKELEKKVEDADKSKEEDSEGRSREARRRARSHTPFGLSAGTLSLSSCLPGHTVLIMWDPDHYNYTVMQEASIMYFVHSECLPALELAISVRHEAERRLYAVAVVESKEYCYAKKSGNRYHMPRASRFYRVRVRPLRPRLPPPPCCDHKHRPEMSKSVDTSQSTSSNTDEANKEVATATLINLESPVSTSEAAPVPTASEDQLDSIEASEQWHNARMHASTASAVTDMECSVGRCLGPEPLELSVSAVSVIARGTPTPVEELAEEAAP